MALALQTSTIQVDGSADEAQLQFLICYRRSLLRELGGVNASLNAFGIMPGDAPAASYDGGADCARTRPRWRDDGIGASDNRAVAAPTVP